MRSRDALVIVRDRVVAVLARLAARATEFADLAMVGRSHNVPAQVTTLGKRFATAAEELLLAFDRLERTLAQYPLRGIKGPVGTQQDQVDLVGAGAEQLEAEVARHLGFTRVLDSVGQVYPRSLDLDVVSALVQVGAAPSSFATTLRLMAGFGLATEGTREGQVGSSGMPHKVNSRSSERVNGLAVVLRGHLSMVAELAGDQWNEGDVSCSVVRRVALPDAFFAADGLLITFMTVLDGFTLHRDAIERELRDQLPYLVTTRIMLALVSAGMGREEAHALVRAHSLAAADGADLVSRLADDTAVVLDRVALEAVLADRAALLGNAREQIAAVAERVGMVTAAHPQAASYDPGDIL